MYQQPTNSDENDKKINTQTTVLGVDRQPTGSGVQTDVAKHMTMKSYRQ